MAFTNTSWRALEKCVTAVKSYTDYFTYKKPPRTSSQIELNLEIVRDQPHSSQKVGAQAIPLLVKSLKTVGFFEKMEESVLSNVCRACLSEEGEFQSIFVPDENCGLNIHLAEMIMAFASVQITLGDDLPEKICLSCANKAAVLYLFKQQCEESDASLRKRLGKSPLTKPYSIAEEQRLAVEALSSLDSYSIVIKPEIGTEQEESQNVQVISNDFSDSYEIDKESDSDLLEIKDKFEVFPCELCSKVFNHLSHLNRHKRVHLVRKPFMCNVCNKAFAKSDALLHHQGVHDVKDPLTSIESILGHELIAENLIEVKSELDDLRCVTCDKICASKEDLRSHISIHTIKAKLDPDRPTCTHCHKKFNKIGHLTRHLKIHAAVKPHACKLCNKSFARSEQLGNHMNAHSGIKPHVCNLCHKGFNQISNLKDHMRTHNGEKPFLCSICGKGFNQLGNLRQHTIRHSGIKAHLCSICGNGFASKGELCAHLRKHTGARPFVCQICNHGFTTSSSLTKHKRIHSGEKPYECEVCKMKFSRSGILARHKRTHTGEKPYVCKFCTKAFSQSNDLSSHLRIHTGEKPYICDTCGQAFRQSSALKTHKKTHIERNSLIEIERARNLVPMIHSTFLNAALP